MKHYHKIFSGVLAASMLFTAIPGVSAASSLEIKNKISDLEQSQSSIQEKMNALQEQENANWESTEEMVEQKNNIDQQIFLLYAELNNLDSQITEYRQLIAQNQQELNQAQDHLAELNEQNKERIRAMEENGPMSYWSVVFKANSFLDLIDRMSMVKEIAEADEKILAEMDAAVQEVERAQSELVTQKAELEASRTQQLAAQEELEAKRTEADEILTQLNGERRTLAADHDAIQSEKDALMAEIAQAEKEYNEAKKREEEERRKQEEALQQQQQQQQQQQEANKPKPETPTAPPANNPPANNDSGWLQPCSYVYISSPYGYRGGGWHNGVDFAASHGTPIYATRSGTVTKARSMTTSYGNHVVINHGDGYSSLYAHMAYYVVSQGEYVNQGQLIGYVGSTGNSSGPHLHFTLMYNGSDVNPMNYL